EPSRGTGSDHAGHRGDAGMKVGFIGVGTMGAFMASNLQAAGHALIVNDVRKEAAGPHLAAGAVWAATPREVAKDAEVIFTSLPGPPEVEAVALRAGGLLSGLQRGAAHLDLSTHSPQLRRRAHPALRAEGLPL